MRSLGVIDLPTLQKKANLHYSLSLDLFGSEISTNAANAFSAGVKGRYRETKINDDHQLTDSTYPVIKLVDGTFYANVVLSRPSGIIEKSGIDFRLDLPNVAFHRQIGEFARVQATPAGEILTETDWIQHKEQFLPSSDDGDYVSSLMQQTTEPGSYASWIEPPSQGIDNQPGDFEYVRIAN